MKIQTEKKKVAIIGLGPLGIAVAKKVQEDPKLELLPEAIVGGSKSKKNRYEVSVNGQQVWCTRRGSLVGLSGVFHGKKVPDLFIVCAPEVDKDMLEDLIALGVPVVTMSSKSKIDTVLQAFKDNDVSAIVDHNHAPVYKDLFYRLAVLPKEMALAIYLKILESHQGWKEDYGKTGPKAISYFINQGNTLIEWDEDMACEIYEAYVDGGYGSINWIRDRNIQLRKYGIPAEHLDGHALHIFDFFGSQEVLDYYFEHLESLEQHHVEGECFVQVRRFEDRVQLEILISGRAVYGIGACTAAHYLLSGGESGDMNKVLGLKSNKKQEEEVAKETGVGDELSR